MFSLNASHSIPTVPAAIAHIQPLIHSVAHSQRLTTVRMETFSFCFIKAKASLILLSGTTSVIMSLILSFLSRNSWTNGGTPLRPFVPPNADPLHTLPVTNWNGLVLISCPEAATPMMHDSPHPLWQHSSAALIVCGNPMHSKK